MIMRCVNGCIYRFGRRLSTYPINQDTSRLYKQIKLQLMMLSEKSIGLPGSLFHSVTVGPEWAATVSQWYVHARVYKDNFLW